MDFFDISFKKFMEKSPYSYFSEGIYDYFEELAVFVLRKDDECEVSKMETTHTIEHKSNNEDNYYEETTKTIREQLNSYEGIEGIIICYRHSNSWNDDKVNERLYITMDSIKKIEQEEIEEAKKEALKPTVPGTVKKVEEAQKVENDIRYLPEEDI
jgi:hypothetical protein